MSERYLLSVDASDDELSEVVRIIRGVASENGATVESDLAHPAQEDHGIVDLAHMIHFILDGGEALALGVFSNALYARLSQRKKQTEVSLHTRTSAREVEIVDTTSGLRVKIRESNKETVTRIGS